MQLRWFWTGLAAIALLNIMTSFAFGYPMGRDPVAGQWVRDPGSGLVLAGLGKTDELGRFAIECHVQYVREVTGSVRELLMGEVCQHLPLAVYLEPHPGVPELMGLGQVGAVWVGFENYEWTRVTGFERNWSASGASIDLGQIAVIPKLSVSCEEVVKDVWIVGEAADQHYTFVLATCTAELTFELDPTVGLRHAKRMTKLPDWVGKACTWIVVEEVEPHQVVMTTYHSDGRVWMERDKEVMKRLRALPTTGELGQAVIVRGAGGKEHVYRWWQGDDETPGRWMHVCEWVPPQEPSPPERDPSEPPGQGEPGAG